MRSVKVAAFRLETGLGSFFLVHGGVFCVSWKMYMAISMWLFVVENIFLFIWIALFLLVL